ncbi:2-isopropylmalate synthase [Moniliophthora roreri]|nr:2-isopropylmalate synthase [Moniliophthora roreri]
MTVTYSWREGHRNFDAQDEYQNFASSAAASLYSARGNEITALKPPTERDEILLHELGHKITEER